MMWTGVQLDTMYVRHYLLALKNQFARLLWVSCPQPLNASPQYAVCWPRSEGRKANAMKLVLKWVSKQVAISRNIKNMLLNIQTQCTALCGCTVLSSLNVVGIGWPELP